MTRRERQEYRDGAGQYARTPGCEICGRPGAEFSDPRCNDLLFGRGLRLCRRDAGRLAAMPADQALRLLMETGKKRGG